MTPEEDPLKNIFDLIEEKATPGTVIPKPVACGDSVEGWGTRRGERALTYSMPSSNNRPYPNRKKVTESELIKAYEQLMENGEFTRKWFNEHMPDCRKQGGCNFTTIGGIFVLLEIARYSAPGVYRKS